ncbi:MAG: SAM-dependent methyltransferase [Candidatus Stygibacter australis]|nr:SAM-dependent methyltransferase [Candidatus Stygibacter australis]MDP8323287.1 SAM-dependent methyltransferase [Candidatus Stygibacter australis]
MEIEKNIEFERPAIYVVATPIGNPYDITLRALNVLSSADLVICEERKVGSRLLRRYGFKQEILEVIEHNEKTIVNEIIHKIISENLAVALISDAGTPLFADPGNTLIPQAYQSGIRNIPRPIGPNLKAMYPEILEYTHLCGVNGLRTHKAIIEFEGNKFSCDKIFAADSTFC